MVPVNGIPLIDRLLGQLSKLDLNRIVIVIGYEGQKLKDYIAKNHSTLNIEYVMNPVYDKTNNIYSLALAKRQLQEDDTLLVESDLIFEDGMFDLLVNNSAPNIALVAKYEQWMDGTMVQIDEDNNIVNFVTKQSFDYGQKDTYYKTVNIYKLAKDFSATQYVPFLEAYTKAVGNNEYYENVLRIISFLDCHNLKALPITNERWYEIDDKQDLDIAETIFADDEIVLQKYYSRYGGYWRFPSLLDFCYLVNPYFSGSRIMDEMKSNFNTLVSEYPSGLRVNTLLASKLLGGVKESYIVPGNGAAELIKILMEVLPGSLGVIRPTFEEYPNRRDGGLVTFIPQNSDYRYNVSDLIEYFSKHKADNLLLINPDNPSGNFIPLADLLQLAEWCGKNQMKLIIDESFVDFTEDFENNTLIKNNILEAYPHLLVMKSISKSYGVPGLRLGVLCSADLKIIETIKKSVSIWNINSFAEFFMQVFTKYEKDYKHACKRLIEERADFESKLSKIGFLRIMPSQANYFLCEVLPPVDVRDLNLKLLRKWGILTRDCSSKLGFDGKQYMRIAVRNHEDNSKLLRALLEIEKAIQC
jgi:histidinol-phosphate/aromatic aminotransferase/cobyric acid decarboxylase-like protein/choline kinase